MSKLTFGYNGGTFPEDIKTEFEARVTDLYRNYLQQSLEANTGIQLLFINGRFSNVVEFLLVDQDIPFYEKEILDIIKSLR